MLFATHCTRGSTKLHAKRTAVTIKPVGCRPMSDDVTGSTGLVERIAEVAALREELKNDRPPMFTQAEATQFCLQLRSQ